MAGFFRQRGTEEAQSAGGLFFYGADRDVEAFGDLLMGELIDFPQQQHLAAPGRQIADGGLQEAPLLAGHHLIGDTRARALPLTPGPSRIGHVFGRFGCRSKRRDWISAIRRVRRQPATAGGGKTVAG